MTLKLKLDPDSLVGKPYDKKNYHCWHFIEECLEVPTLSDIAVDTAVQNIYENMPYFQECDTLDNYCLVLLGEKHIGIYYDNHIYHNDIGGVKCEPFRQIARKYTDVKFYERRENT